MPDSSEIVVTFVRHQRGTNIKPRFFVLGNNNPSIGKVCPACNHYFLHGQTITLIVLGPGDDVDAREKCQQGRWYNAVCVAVHRQCSELGPEPPLSESLDPRDAEDED